MKTNHCCKHPTFQGKKVGKEGEREYGEGGRSRGREGGRREEGGREGGRRGDEERKGRREGAEIMA